MSDLRSPNGLSQPSQPLPRLTRRQLSLIYDLAQGFDIATVAERRGRGLSSTYELAERVCARCGLSEWQEIGPWAVERGLGDSDGQEASENRNGLA
jgi:DNA-binding NarL/FixJ family response regulator